MFEFIYRLFSPQASKPLSKAEGAYSSLNKPGGKNGIKPPPSTPRPRVTPGGRRY